MSGQMLPSLEAAISAGKSIQNNGPWLTAERRQMLDIFPACVLVSEDPACAFIHGNAAAEALLYAQRDANLAPSAIDAGTRSFEAFDADGILLAVDQSPIQRAARGEVLADAEFEWRFEDGASVFLQGAAMPLRDENGAIHGAIGAFADISAWKKRERELLAEVEAGRARQEALQTSGAHDPDLAMFAPAILWAADLDGAAAVENDKWLSYTGQTREQARGAGWMATIHPDDVQRVGERWLESVATGADFDVEHHLRRASDGAWRWHLTKAKLQRDNLGHPFRWYGTCVDIEDRKQAENARRESEQMFRTVFENAASGIAIVPAFSGGVFLRTNDRLCEMLGYGPGELAGRSFMELTHPDDREISAEKVRAILAGEISTLAIEKRYLRRDGSFIWANISLALMRDEASKPTFFIASIVDISERKLAEQALRGSEERFRVLVETNARILFETDPAGELIDDLPTWAAFSGQTPEDWSQEGWADAIHPDDREQAVAGWRDAVKAGVLCRTEHRFRRADGEWRWGSLMATPLRGADGEIVRWIGMISDITERKQAEQQLAESEARFRAAQESSLDGFVIYEPVEDEGGGIVDLKFVYINPIAAKYCRRSPEETEGRLISDFLPGARAC